MLYLNSLLNHNQEQDTTGRQYTVSRDKVVGMTNIDELIPSKELLSQWESRAIPWEDFRNRYMNEMRTEYRKGDKSRLKGLADYCLKNDVTLYSPEPPGEQTYRAILGEIVTGIWKRQGKDEQVLDLALEVAPASGLTEPNLRKMEEIASTCNFFTPAQTNSQGRSCRLCEHLDHQVYACPKINDVVVEYKWID